MSITITDVDELQAMGDDLTEDYILGNDIDASATETWNINNGFIPIGFYGTPFSGTFDGAGHTISDFWSRRSTADNVGLFGEVDGATIQDVTLKDFTILGEDKVGSLAGEVDNSTISDVIVTNASVTAERNYAGGLIGDVNTCTISESSTTGSVSGEYYVGGLMGACYTSTIKKCYTTVNVASSDNYIGGLIGLSYGNDIDNCYARGSVDGTQYIGGLLGYSFDSEGIPEIVDDCFSTGVVTGDSDVGGLVGYSAYFVGGSSAISNCFWDITTSGQATSDGGTGYTTAQMKLFCIYYPLWDIGQAVAQRNDGYPFLSWEIDESATIWQIFGEGTYGGEGTDFDFPDLLDDKGRPVKNAVVDAIRTDTHSIVATKRTDANGTANFDELPIGQDVVFHAKWGGKSTEKKEEWFFLRVNDLEDGGTGSGTADGALDNLGVHGAAIMWELVLGD